MSDINEMGGTENYKGVDTTIVGGNTTVGTTINENSTTGNVGYESTVIGGNSTAGSVGYGSTTTAGTEFKPVENALPVKTGFWSKVKAFLFQEIDWHKEIKVELTPYQQKVEDEINEFLHQEITWSKVKSFLFKEIKF